MENTLLVSNVFRLIRLHLTVRRPETEVKISAKAKLIVHLIFTNIFEIAWAYVWNLLQGTDLPYKSHTPLMLAHAHNNGGYWGPP